MRPNMTGLNQTAFGWLPLAVNSSGRRSVLLRRFDSGTDPPGHQGRLAWLDRLQTPRESAAVGPSSCLV